MSRISEQVKYTVQQQQVINHKGGNLLVSASAGSGKTRVLIAKIINLILSKQANLKELLVVTFTNDASHELRQRLSKELQNSNERELLEQLDDISVSDILTFDKFCIKIVREFGYSIGVNGNFSVADDSLTKFLQSKALDNIFAEHNKNLDIKFTNLMNYFFTSRNTTSLKSSIVKIYNFLRSKVDNVLDCKPGIEKAYDINFVNNEPINYLNKYILTVVNNYKTNFNNLLLQVEKNGSIALKELFEKAYQNFELFNNDIENNLTVILNNLSFPFTRKKLTADEQDIYEEYKIVKDQFIKNFNFIKNGLKNISLSQVKNDLVYTKNNLITLLNIVSEFDIEFKNLKSKYQILDFYDIEQLANQILNNNAIRESLQEKYKYIFIDEYQDTNDLQESIVKKITKGNNLFMVGDVKQSIYRFRNAEPQIFINKYKLYKDFQTTNTLIELNKNFRSDIDILEFANTVFNNIMTEQTADIDYKNTAKLEFGGEYLCDENLVKVIVVNNTKKEQENLIKKEVYSVKNSKLIKDDFKQLQQEVLVVVQQIHNLIGKTYYDSSSKTYKTIDFGDIAILSRKKSNVMLIIRDILKKAQMPVNCQYKNKLFNNYDVEILVNLLKCIENLQNDTALISSLSSIVGGLSFQELAEIRQFDGSEYFYQAVQNYINNKQDDISFKLASFYNKINNYKLLQHHKNICELICEIVIKEKLDSYFAINNYGDEFENHLHLLLQSIDSIKNYSLTEFINYLETFGFNNEYDETISDGDNSITISTIHASKGLEYPVVFLIDTGSNFGSQSVKEKILLENNYGLASKNFNAEDKIEYDSPISLGFKLKINDEQTREEMRLLYVALTRPKHFLTVVGSLDLNKYILPKNSFEISNCNNYLSWILSVLNSNQISKLIKNEKVELCTGKKSAEFIKIDGEIIENNIVENTFKNINSEIQFNNLQSILNAEFKHSNIRKKQSASMVLEQDYINIPKNKNHIKNSDQDFVFIGTEYHKFMQLLDFSKLDEISNQINTALNNGLINQAEVDLIDTKCLENAIKDINKFIDNNDVILKEKQFLCYLPANELINTESTEKILVQGVADLIIVKPEEIILIDYKTSRIKDEKEFAKRYASQLNIYAKAIESYYHKKVSKKIIYSFYLNKPVLI